MEARISKALDVIEYCAHQEVLLTLDDGQLKAKSRVTMSTNLITAINECKSEIMQLLQKDKALSTLIKRADVQPEKLPLSKEQESLLLASEVSKREVYNLPICFQFSGEIDEAILDQSVSQLIDRHKVLCCHFVSDEETNFQYISENITCRCQVINCTSKNDFEQQVYQELCFHFDLENELPLRITLYRLSAQDSRLLFNFHHIVCDGWSLSVFVRDFSEIYTALQEKRLVNLPALAIQYTDFTLWQRSWLEGKTFYQQAKYWTTVLKDAPNVHPLPLDRERFSKRNFGGKQIPFDIPRALLKELEGLASANNTTLYTVLQTAFTILVSRWSRTIDVVIGMPVSGRGRDEINELIGFFVNTVALYNKIDHTNSFINQLAATRLTILEALENRLVPLSVLIEHLAIDRNNNVAPLVQLMFAVHDREKLAMQLGKLAGQSIDLPMWFAKFELSVDVYVDSCKVVLEYMTELFEETTIQRLGRSYLSLLSQIVSDPSVAVGRLPIWDDYSEQARYSYQGGLSAIASVHPDIDRGVWDLFSEVSERCASQLAYQDGQSQVSYQELRERSLRKALELQRQGVCVGDRVGIGLSRSGLFVEWMLATVALGGVYVPLDPSYPADRLQLLLGDSSPKVVVCDERWSVASGLRELRAEVEGEEGVGSVSLGDVSGEGFLYMMYTSGTTGVPKGVEVTHRGVIRLVRSPNYVSLGKETVMGYGSNVSFDASTFELWGSLLNGGKLVLIDQGTLLDGAALQAQLLRDKINTMVLTPALLTQLVDTCPSVVSSLDTLLFGGDVCSLSTLEKIFKHGKPRCLVNGYGPTENTTFSTSCEVEQRHIDEGVVPIGRPIAQSGVWVLDEHQRPLAPGALGELVVTGLGLARGYWGRAELTQEKFIELFNGERGYRTGDLVRWSTGGELLFEGRLDDQVKLRGFRVELGEVASVLQGQAGVSQAVVVMDDRLGDRHLVGYVVMEAGVEAQGLRASLQQVLPAYMIPDSIQTLDSLPLTANGKLDKSKLPNPIFHDGYPYLAPQNDLEKLVHSVFAKHLQISPQSVSVNNSFFALGGNSLIAMRMIRDLSNELKTSLSVVKLFEYNTVRALADYIKKTTDKQTTDLPDIKPSANKRMSLSSNELGLWYLYQRGCKTEYNMPMAYMLMGDLQEQTLRQAFKEVFLQHQTLSSIIKEEAGHVFRTSVSEEKVLAQIQVVKDKDLNALRNYLFDLEQECPFKIHIIRKADAVLLYLLVHHIAADGYSIFKLLQEVDACYRQLVMNKKITLSPPSIQMADFAHWQNREGVQKLYNQWVEQQVKALTEASPTHQLPLLPSTGGKDQADCQFIQQININLRDKVLTTAKDQQCSAFSVVLAAFGQTICRLMNDTSVVVGIPTLGRIKEELNDTIGYLVNPVPLLLTYTENDTASEVIRRAYEGLKNVIHYQALPFKRLAAALPAAQKRHPVFQIMIGWQEDEWQVDELFGLKAKAIESSSQGNKYDLLLNIAPQKSGLSVYWEFDPTLFSLEQVKSWANRFEALMTWICYNPQSYLKNYAAYPPIGELVPLADSQLLAGFHTVCKEQSEHTAAIYDNIAYSYRLLDEQSNRLANCLVAKGIDRHCKVVVLLDQSVEQLTALLAIMKVGGAYIPLSGDTRTERIKDIVVDSKADLLITQTSKSKHLDGTVSALSSVNILTSASSQPGQLRTLLLDEWDLQHSSYSVIFHDRKRSHDSIAYIIYTSGSTGEPKGVSIMDSGILRLVDPRQQYLTFTRNIVIGQAANFSFDAATFEVWGSLLNGGTLIAIPYECLLAPDQLSNLINSHQVKVLFLTTALFNNYSRDNSYALAKLDTLLFGGEACSIPAVIAFMKNQPQVKLTHVYGPTEVCTFSTYAPLSKESVDASGEVPIGKPIWNTSVLVKNKLNQYCLDAEPGELWLGGPGVTLNYLDKPAASKKAFIHYKGNRYYRTGDIVRLNKSQELIFIGREDKQVKIRGFRVEISAVDYCLKKFEGVEKVFTTVRKRVEGNSQLVSFLVVSAKFNQQELIAYLSVNLPDYMVPSTTHIVDHLPLNNNGKVDERQLVAHLEEYESANRRKIEMTATERQITHVWCVVLGSSMTIEPESDFFEIGGNSLLMMRMRSQINQDFNVNVSVAEVMKRTKLAELAQYVDLLTLVGNPSKKEFEEIGTI